MSSDAKCSFCSKVDDTIHVICEKRCLICAHCQRASGIRQLLIRCLERAVISSKGASQQCDPQCPLCHHPMAPNMVTNIKRSRKELATQTRLTASEALLETPNVLRQLQMPARKRELKSMRSGLIRQQSTAGNGTTGGAMAVSAGRKSISPQRLSIAAVTRNNGNTQTALTEVREEDMESLNSLDESVSSMGGDDNDEDGRGGRGAARRTTRMGSTVGASPARGRKSSIHPRAMSPSTSTSRPGSRGGGRGGGGGTGPGTGTGGDLEEDGEVPTSSQQMQVQPPFTQQMAIDLIVEVYVKMWNAYMQDNFEPLSSHLRDALCRGRMSKNMVDAKVKNVMEFFSNVQPDTTVDPSFVAIHQQQHHHHHHHHQQHGKASTLDSPQHPFRPSVLSPSAQSRPGSSSCPAVGAAYSVVNTHLHLFGSLLGLPCTSPGQQQQQPVAAALPVIPMQGYIAVLVIVMAVCERCLRHNQLLSVSEDGLGTQQPSSVELAAKLCPVHLATRQPLTGKKLTCIPLKKAISILRCLVQTDEYRFNMTALKSACIEYGVSLPWQNKASLSALLHCLVSFNGDGQSLLVGNYTASSLGQQPDAEKGSAPASTQVPPVATTGAGTGTGPAKMKRFASSMTLSGVGDGQNSGAGLFPPIHLLAGAVQSLWDKKTGLKTLTFDTALSICKTRGQLINLPYFVSICVEAWKVELNCVLHTIKICRQANLRRHGLRPHTNPFQQGANSMKISDKKALKYIYDVFADKTVSTFEAHHSGEGSSAGGGNRSRSSSNSKADILSAASASSAHETLQDTQRTGIDWEEVRERATKTATIGAIPFISDVSAFLSKSNAELEHLTRLVMLETCKRREWQHLMDGYGWQDEWCWGGISIKGGKGGGGEEEAGEGGEEQCDPSGSATVVSQPLSHLPPTCTASVAVATVRRREKFRMCSPAKVEQSQWDVLSMHSAAPVISGVGDEDAVAGQAASLIREKLYAVLQKASGGRREMGYSDMFATGDVFKEEEEEEEQAVDEKKEEKEEKEGQDDKEEQEDPEELTGEQQDTHEEMATLDLNKHEGLAGGLEESGPERGTGGTLSRQASRAGLLRRSPSIQELLHDDFRTYFKETNTRTVQIKKQLSSDILLPGKSRSKSKSRQGQRQKQHFVVCDSQGGYAVENQAAVSQLYLKQQGQQQQHHVGEEGPIKRGAVLRPASNHLLTPITVAPYLEYRQGQSQASHHGAGSSEWDSPQPVRHRVHLSDIVSAKNAPSDLFVKTGLLRPLVFADPNTGKEGGGGADEDSSEQQQQQQQQEMKEDESGGENHEELGREQTGHEGWAGSESQPQLSLAVGGTGLQQSASAPTLQVLSTLSQLEFTVPPSELAQRLMGPPLGQQGECIDEEGGEGGEDTGGLIFRTMSPVGSRHRSHVDLGHFSHMRPSEQPQLSQDACMQSLNLADSLLSAAALANVLESLTTRKNKHIFQHLHKLDLSGNKLGDEGILCLSDALSGGCPHLSDVSIRGNQVTDAGAVELLQAILDGGGGASLLKLDLGGNLLTLGLPRLAELLTHLPNLRVLDLSWNTITLVTFAEKASARSLIEQCRHLQVFSVAYNRMGDAGVALLLQALESAPFMQLVDLAYCFCTEKVLKPLLSLVQRPRTEHIGAGAGGDGGGVALVMLHGVALPLAGTAEVIAAGEQSGRRVILEGHHTGISINLKYE